jgi:hypothetical protein
MASWRDDAAPARLAAMVVMPRVLPGSPLRCSTRAHAAGRRCWRWTSSNPPAYANGLNLGPITFN